MTPVRAPDICATVLADASEIELGNFRTLYLSLLHQRQSSPDLLALVYVRALPVLGPEPRLADAPVGPGAVLSGMRGRFRVKN